MPNYNKFTEVKQKCQGRWREILSRLGGISPDILDGKNHPCPKCGGKDRFRLIDEAVGALFCNQCFKTGNGDGIAALGWLLNIRPLEVANMVEAFLGIGSAYVPEKTPPKANRPLGTEVATYRYEDEKGELLYQVVRFEPKDFRQRKPKAGGGWDYSLGNVRRVLYRFPELLAADPAELVFLVEGEKDANRLSQLGLVATCNAGGAGKWLEEYSEALKNRRVVVLPDNDEAGEKHVGLVLPSISIQASEVKVLRLPRLPMKGDVSDWLNAGGTKERLLELASETEDWEPGEADQATSEEEIPLIPVAEFVPFPVDALPEPLSGFVTAAAKAICCDPSFVALPVLAVAGAAIGTTRQLRIKSSWFVPAIVWGAIVGESGTAKSPAFKLAMKPVRELQRKALAQHAEAMEIYKQDLARYDRELAAYKKLKVQSGDPPFEPTYPQVERQIVSDTTIEALAPLLLANPRGLLMARDELAGWIGSFDRYSGGKGGGDSSHWLSVFNGENIIVDRKTGEPRTIYIPQASVWICGGIQPGILAKALGREHRESGLAARILLVNPPRKAKSWTDASIEPQAEFDYAQLIERLYRLGLKPAEDGELRAVTFGLTQAAKKAFVTYYNSHAIEQADLTGDLAAAWSKLEEYAARLALVIHCCRWAADDPTLESADKVDVLSMEAGIRLAEWFKGEAKRVYGMLGESAKQKEQRQLIEWIRRQGGRVTARQAQQGCRWLREQGAADAALGELVKAGAGNWENSPTNTAGGRPTCHFVLSTSTKPPPSTAKTEVSLTVDNVGGESVEI